MVSSAGIIVLCLLSLTAPAFAGSQIYRYTDDAGTLNFTTERDRIPEQYRDHAVLLQLDHALPPEMPPVKPIYRVISSTGEYRMGDHDTRLDATRIASEYAKRQALEQVATYLESVTEVKNLDLTRDELRSYTAGIVTVLDQQTSTRLADGEIVMHVDLTARVDEREVVEAIAALREDENAKQELVSIRAETDRLRQQLDAANQALATATTSEQVQALTLRRQQMLNRIQSRALMAESKTGQPAATAETDYPSSLARLKRFLSGPVQ